MKLRSASILGFVPRSGSFSVRVLRLGRMLIWSERGTTLKSTDLCASPSVGRLHRLPELYVRSKAGLSKAPKKPADLPEGSPIHHSTNHYFPV
jgi:hypothetical protein